MILHKNTQELNVNLATRQPYFTHFVMATFQF